ADAFVNATRSGLRTITAALLLGSFACKPDATKLADHLERSASWLSAVQMAGNSWAQNRIPVRFAERLVDESRKSLKKSASAVASLDLPDGAAGEASTELSEAAH